ncbi:hypothetical protein AAFF_G00063670, partial [Aldrovandia affinis]
MCDGTGNREGGGLNPEVHQSWPVQWSHCEDDAPPGFVPDGKWLPAGGVPTLLQDGEGRAVLQDPGFGEGGQAHHVVIGWD